MSDAFAELPPPRAGCRLSVAIPARDEEASIGAVIAALAGQRAPAGGALAADALEVVVLVNNALDATAERARAAAAAAPRTAVHVVETTLVPAMSNVGTARRLVTDAAAARLAPLGARGAVALTDADTVAHDLWAHATLAELERVDVVAGRVVPAVPPDASGAVRAAAACEQRWRFALARLESLLDPQPHDPWPRHENNQGASLAVRCDAYAAAGGVPALEVLEDYALYRALVRDDARVRHSLRVRVATSARRTGRVAGGYATQLGRIDAHLAGDRPYVVTSADGWATRWRGRAALRRLWRRDGARDRAAEGVLDELYGLGPAGVRDVLAAHATLGRAVDAVEADAAERGVFAAMPHVPLDAAIRGLESAARRYGAGGLASAARPTRISA